MKEPKYSKDASGKIIVKNPYDKGFLGNFRELLFPKYQQ